MRCDSVDVIDYALAAGMLAPQMKNYFFSLGG
jgi:hypothetical protein